jgi:NADH-quinone oxidoreductase subunit C
MTNEDLQKRILQLEPEAVCKENKEYLIAEIPSKSLFTVAKALRESADTEFDYLFSLTGVDNNPSLGVVYHIESTKFQHIIVLKTSTDNRENPVLDSVCSIWVAAELQEREVFDFFGISFNNHPDMRRIFLDDDWKGFPLRKDYVDTVNIVDLIK